MSNYTVEKYFQEVPKGIYYVSEYSDVLQNYIDEFKKDSRVIYGLSKPTMAQVDEISKIIGDTMPISRSYVMGLLGKISKGYKYFNGSNITIVGSALYSSLLELKNNGKNESVLKNFLITCMCWVKYDMSGILAELDPDSDIRLLYIDDRVSRNEAMFLKSLSEFHILIVATGSSGGSVLSDFTKIDVDNGAEFTDDDRCRIGAKPVNITEVKTEKAITPGMLSLVNGVCDSVSDYVGLLYAFYESNKDVVIVNGSLPLPNESDIGRIKYIKSPNIDRVISVLYGNLGRAGGVAERFVSYLQELFGRCPSDESQHITIGIKFVYWINKYLSKFKDTSMCFILFTNSYVSMHEWYFLDLLRVSGFDVLVFNPSKVGQDYGSVQVRSVSMKNSFGGIGVFPVAHVDSCLSNLSFGSTSFEDMLVTFSEKETDGVETVAHKAEEELTGILYTDTGFFRDRQYSRGVSTTLKTSYDEVGLLWKEDLKYRPGFSVEDGVVTIPSLFAVIYGVPNGDVKKYVSSIRSLECDDTIMFFGHPYFDICMGGYVQGCCGRYESDSEYVNRIIKGKYGYLRDDIQMYLYEKIAMLVSLFSSLDGEGKNILLKVISNIDKRVLQLINGFDFTKRNPKLVIVEPGEYKLSLVDSIYVSLLNLAGFDIAIYVPTGYNILGEYIIRRPCEYQAGEYMYNIDVNKSLLSKIKSILG